MRDEATFDDYAYAVRPPTMSARPGLVLLVAAVTALISAATCTGAILAPAPAAAIPLVVAICIGCPIFAGWEVPNALAALRSERAGRALARLRRTLDALPETEHPLGL
jgi:hypothetical protein